MAVLVGRARPTRGFLLELKRRIKFIEDGYELLKTKRDELAKALWSYLEELEVKRREFERKAERALSVLRKAYICLGSEEADSQVRLIEKKLAIQVSARSIMGIVVPYVEILSRPSFKNKLGPLIREVAREFEALIEDLLVLAGLEARIERVADDLEKTNRKVNALEKIVIPEYRRVVKNIEDMLDEEMLEEFVRTKIVRDLIVSRRG